MSLTCSSSQAHSSADVFESFATEVASPTRAHGMRYYNKSEKRMGQDDWYSTRFYFIYLAVQPRSLRRCASPQLRQSAI